MPAILADDDAILAIVNNHRRDDGSINSTTLAAELGMSRSTVQRRLSALAVTGRLGTRPVLPNFAIKQTTTRYENGEVVGESIVQKPAGPVEAEIRDGFTISRISTYRDATGAKTSEWIQQKPGERSIEDVVSYLKTAFDDYAGAASISTSPPRVSVFSDCLALFPLPDLHLGMFAWGRETERNWDLKIAEREIGDAFENVVTLAPSTATAVLLGGGDQIHADSNENKTAKSGNILQVDGRYPKVVMAACRLFVRATDALLTKHQSVTVRILRGNHDEHACVAIAYFLLAHYRNEPRVFVDVDPSLFWWLRFGKVLLGATHGHAAKPGKMPEIMAHRRAEDWGKTKYRFAHTFHVHHSERTTTEGGGVITETHQAPIPQDAWHFESGFLSGQSLCAIIYDPNKGEVARNRVVIS